MDEVHAVPLQEFVGFSSILIKQVARRTAFGAGIALTPQRQLHALFHTGWNFNINVSSPYIHYRPYTSTVGGHLLPEPPQVGRLPSFASGTQEGILDLPHITAAAAGSASLYRVAVLAPLPLHWSQVTCFYLDLLVTPAAISSSVRVTLMRRLLPLCPVGGCGGAAEETVERATSFTKDVAKLLKDIVHGHTATEPTAATMSACGMV